MARTENLYNVNDGIHGRDGGPYLDQQQQKNLEDVNAARENREPDYDNLPLHPGIVAVTEGVLRQVHNSTSLAGDDQNFSGDITAPVLAQTVIPEEGDEGGPVDTEEETEKVDSEEVVSNPEKDDTFNPISGL